MRDEGGRAGGGGGRRGGETGGGGVNRPGQQQCVYGPKGAAS